MKKSSIREAFGWIGVLAILAAYGLNVFGLLLVSSPAYLLMNLLGSIGVGIDAYAQRNWQPVVLNTFWMAIAIIGLIRTFLA